VEGVYGQGAGYGQEGGCTGNASQSEGMNLSKYYDRNVDGGDYGQGGSQGGQNNQLEPK